MTIRINVIDPDVRRRARIARELSARDAHVEIYEDVSELGHGGNVHGLMFVSDEPAGELSSRIEHIREIAQTALPFVGYAVDPKPEHVVAGMRAGALDYLSWPFDEVLIRAVFKRLANGNDSLFLEENRRTEARAKIQCLSRREAAVLTQLVKGLSNKKIGAVLGISPRTVEIHRANMLDKLGASSALDAVRIGVHAGLDSAGEPIDFLGAADSATIGYRTPEHANRWGVPLNPLIQ